MFQSRLRKQAQHLGYEIAIAATEESVREGMDRSPTLVVIDLHITGVDWKRVIEEAQGANVPVLAFGRHTEPHLLRSAREAGCTRVVPRSTFVEQLPQLIEELAQENHSPAG